ncbi:MAG: D-glycero-beta-D-manno-heptose-7-phosphate kinase [Candidatus Eisenbacteria bacterium]
MSHASPATTTPVFDRGRLAALVDRFTGRRILVLGDVMLDRYLWGRVDRISPEAPVPVVDVERQTETLGGAGNVAANLRALGAEATLAGLVGQDPDGESLVTALGARGVDTRLVVRDAARPTTVKTRVIAHSQQVVRFDREGRSDVDGVALDTLLGGVTRALESCDGLIVSDYGKGVITRPVLERVIASAHARRVHVSVDPKESHIDAYRGVGILTPNQFEAGAVMGRRIVDEASLLEVGRGLRQRLDAAAVLVTRGPQGMSLFERDGRITHLPTVAREVYDVTGAGDTVVSVVALALAAGADYPEACTLSNHAAGIVIREIGTAACTPRQLLDSLAGGAA